MLNEEKRAGTVDFQMDISFLHAGTYLYRLQAGDHIKYGKIIKIK